jgi:TPR repeat protein
MKDTVVSKALYIIVVLMLSGLLTRTWSMSDEGLEEIDKANALKDYETVYRLIRESALEGDTEAQYFLGLLYADGIGVKRDYAEAVLWYRKSADHGYPAAQYELGVYYAGRSQKVVDFEKAVFWYRKAAEQGYAKAQHNLGVKYAKGEGVAQNYVQAYVWFSLAARQGDALAQKNRDQAASLMTPQQRSEAQKTTEEYYRNYVEPFKCVNEKDSKSNRTGPFLGAKC